MCKTQNIGYFLSRCIFLRSQSEQVCRSVTKIVCELSPRKKFLTVIKTFVTQIK